MYGLMYGRGICGCFGAPESKKPPEGGCAWCGVVALVGVSIQHKSEQAPSAATDVVPPDRVAGKDALDTGELLTQLRKQLGEQRLLVLGGSETNSNFLAHNLVDELFLTVAPKIKLGRDIPTYAGGEALPREAMLDFQIVEHHVIGDEVFLRYRRKAQS